MTEAFTTGRSGDSIRVDGLKLSPGVGGVVAAAVLDRPLSFDVRPLPLERFAQGEPMYLAYGPSARA